jgi:hypothetical protein
VTEPSCCLSIVLLNKRAAPSLECGTQCILRICKSLLRSEAEQSRRLGGVGINDAVTAVVKVAQDVLRLGKSFIGGKTEEVDRHVVIHRKPVAFVVTLA